MTILRFLNFWIHDSKWSSLDILRLLRVSLHNGQEAFRCKTLFMHVWQNEWPHRVFTGMVIRSKLKKHKIMVIHRYKMQGLKYKEIVKSHKWSILYSYIPKHDFSLGLAHCNMQNLQVNSMNRHFKLNQYYILPHQINMNLVTFIF